MYRILLSIFFVLFLTSCQGAQENSGTYNNSGAQVNSGAQATPSLEEVAKTSTGQESSHGQVMTSLEVDAEEVHQIFSNPMPESSISNSSSNE